VRDPFAIAASLKPLKSKRFVGECGTSYVPIEIQLSGIQLAPGEAEEATSAGK
jgi:hypothetical protein